MATYIANLSNGTQILVKDAKFRNSGILSGTKIAQVIGKNEDGTPIFHDCEPVFQSGWDYTAAHLYKEASTLPKAVDLLVCIVPRSGYNAEAECSGDSTTFVFGVPYGTSDSDVNSLISDAKQLVISKGLGYIQKTYRVCLPGTSTPHNVVVETFNATDREFGPQTEG